MSSSSSSSQGVWIAASIATVSLSVLWTRSLDAMTAGFFNDFSLSEQIATMALLFSVMFAVASVSAAVAAESQKGRGGAGGILLKKVVEAQDSLVYPLAELEAQTNEKEKFLCLYPLLRQELLEHVMGSAVNDMPAEAVQWVERMIDYNVPGGKLNRGMTVPVVYKALWKKHTSDKTLPAAEYARAAVLGWTIEFLQAFFLVADDVMDDSQTRRGQPCWYKNPHVQKIAINDSFLLESFVFSILKRHFAADDCYADLQELLLDVIQKTEFGQLLDLTSQPLSSHDNNNNTKPGIDLNRFTLERYRKIVQYKTAFYSFYLPVAMGMLLAGHDNEEDYETAKRICCIMGEYFQIQDDYLDCYGDPAVIGKVGTDIQDNKCSWLVVQALQRANQEQRVVLEQNYGVWDNGKVAKIKALYKELKLEDLFHEYEEESYRKIQEELDRVTTMPREVFELLLKKIYKRSK